MGASFRKVGDWDKVQGLVGNIGKEMIEARDTSLKRFGLKAEKIAVTHISLQDLHWQPLSPKYLAEKIREGYSENILVRTSTYFQSITSWVEKETAYAGVKRDVVDKDGQLVADIAKLHEYGSKSGAIPARPLWQPTFDEVLKWHKLENMPEKIFLKNIKSRYGI